MRVSIDQDLMTSYNSGRRSNSDSGSAMTPPDSDGSILDPSGASTEILKEKLIAPPQHIPCVRDKSVKDEEEHTLDDLMQKAIIGPDRYPPLSAQGVEICELTWKLCVSAKCMYEGNLEKRSGIRKIRKIRKKLWGWFAEDFSQWDLHDTRDFVELERWLKQKYPPLWKAYLGHVCPP